MPVSRHITVDELAQNPAVQAAAGNTNFDGDEGVTSPIDPTTQTQGK